jgi:hypothetical protein
MIRKIEQEIAVTMDGAKAGANRPAAAQGSANGKTAYDRLSRADSTLSGDQRFIGRCKRCGKTRKIEGRIATGHKVPEMGGGADYVVQDGDGALWTTADMGTNPSKVWAPCGDHHVALHRVIEGRKASKHQCGARCTSATGPNCDCRCRGENHGRDC